MKRILLFLLIPLSLSGQIVYDIDPSDTIVGDPSGVIDVIGKVYVSADGFDSTDSYYYNFGGVDNFLIVQDFDAISPTGNVRDTAFYFSFWAKITEQDGGFFIKTSEYSGNLTTASDYLVFDVFDRDGNNVGRRTGSVAAYYNAWHHYVFYYNGTASAAGVDIYIDTVAKDASNRATGTYDTLLNKAGDLWIGRYADTYLKSKMLDFRYGIGTLAAGDLTKLYNHQFTGKEELIYPMTEGYGEMVHNVTNNNPLYAAKITTDAGNVSWDDTTQVQWDYNNTFGYTKIDDYIFPNLIDGTSSIRYIGGYLQAGQSNADGLGNQDSLLTASELDIIEAKENALGFMNSGDNWQRFDPVLFYSTDYFGVESPIIQNYFDDSDTSWIIKYAVNGSYLHDTTGLNDWNAGNAELWTAFRGYVKSGMDQLFQMGVIPYIKGFIWIQGEADATKYLAALNYEDNLTALIDSVNALTGSTVDLQLPKLGTKITYGYKASINTAQTNVIAIYGGNQINTDAYIYEGAGDCCLHYNHDDLINMGNTIYTNTKDNASNDNYLDVLFPGGFTIDYNNP